MANSENQPDSRPAAGKTRNLRIDLRHNAPPPPHLFEFPNRYELQRLRMLLDNDDLDLQEFRQELAPSKDLQRYIVAFANSRLGSSRNRVTDPVHAFAMLGLNGLQSVLADLTEHVRVKESA